MEESLDCNKLAYTLDKVNSNDNVERKENENRFSKYKFLPNFGPLLLLIACDRDNQYGQNITHNAAIQLKNYINSYWKYGKNEKINKQLSFDNEQIIIISDEDKNIIRNNILEGVICIVKKGNIKILRQFNQCVKKILKLDYFDIWNNKFIDFIIKCFDSQKQNIIIGGIMLFYQLSKLFEFEDKKPLENYNEVLVKVNNKLIFFLNECKNLKNSVEATVVYKLIKIFFKNFQGNVPDIFKNEEIFNSWSEFIVLMIKTPLESQYIEDKKNIFWKIKNICFQTLTRIIQKYTNLTIKNKSEFQKLLENKYIQIYLEVFTVIYKNYNNNQNYVDDNGKAYIYSFYTYLLGKKKFKEIIIKLFLENNDLIEEIIKDSFIAVEDLETWANDQKNYISQKSQEINFYQTKRYKAMQFFKALLDCKEKKNKETKYICYNKLFEYLIKSMINDNQNLEQEKNAIKTIYIKDPKVEDYITNPKNIPHCLKKESIIFLLKNNAELVIQNSSIEDVQSLIDKFIYPELFSPCGLLREQSCDFIFKFYSFTYKDNGILEKIIRKLAELMQGDPQLSVQLYASLAIGSLFDNDLTKNLLKGNIQKIFEINLKLMEETDTEEIMDILQKIVDCFTEESQQYIVQLSEYLIKYFYKIISKDDEDDKQYMDNMALETNIIDTFCKFIEHFINNQNIYPKIEQYIDKLLEYCLNNIYEKLEEGLDIIESILKYSDITPNHVWKFFIPLIESVIGSKEELEEHSKENPNEIFIGRGIESILDIEKIVSIFIAKDPELFIKIQDNNGIKYFDYVVKLIESIISKSEKDNNYSEIKYTLRIICTLFDCFKGKIDKLMNDLIKYILIKYKIGHKNQYLYFYLQNLLSLCFIYDPLKALKIVQNNNCTKDIFIFWFNGLDKLKTISDIKYNLIGLCSLISIDQNNQDKLIIENMKQIIEKIYLLTDKINNIIKNNLNDNNNYDDNDNLEDYDNAEDEGNNKFDEMINKYIEGGQDNIDDDDDLSYEERDDDDRPLTNFEKQSPILFVKNTLNVISQKSPNVNKIIVEALGDKFDMLNNIFNNEEQRLANKNK
jgi:hypothetical protein